MLRLTNTRTGRKETFHPAVPGLVRMYVCGPTVYDDCHIGHGRSFVVFDVLKRYLTLLGNHVCHVQNFTDIDERIADKARELGEDPFALSTRYITSYHTDMDWLGVVRASFYPRTSEHIDDCVELAQRLTTSGHSYAVDGDVFLARSATTGLTDLTRQSLEQVLCGTAQPINPHKRDPLDFAIWKGGADWGVSWSSPWGRGHPGWHTECAAMACAYLGPSLDLHGGGMDLIYPHHDSEGKIAEAASGVPFSSCWLHNGFVTMDSVKMSKSRGNFVSLRELRSGGWHDQVVDPSALRLLLLSTTYRSTVAFTAVGLALATRQLDRVRAAWQRLAAPAGITGPQDGVICALTPGFLTALDADLDSGQAIRVLLEVSSLVLEAPTLGPAAHEAARGLLQEAGQILGLALAAGGAIPAPPVPPPPAGTLLGRRPLAQRLAPDTDGAQGKPQVAQP